MYGEATENSQKEKKFVGTTNATTSTTTTKKKLKQVGRRERKKYRGGGSAFHTRTSHTVTFQRLRTHLFTHLDTQTRTPPSFFPFNLSPLTFDEIPPPPLSHFVFSNFYLFFFV